ncbi:S-layer homology domain-containing protein [Paenibacillus sp. FA6]|uniref:S-layer homology domain-containing protein n=1 Tax=Paenibacillus sp. FA6 TaxID=3413029 RepID=UPI003F6590BD
MKLRKLSVMLILALCVSLVPISAFAASSAITLNAVAPIEQGGSVTISGTSTLDEVIIQVLRPGNNSTVFYDITKVTNRQFSSAFTLLGSEAAGTYKVVAGQGNQVDTKDLVVTVSDIIVPPTQPIDPPVITVPDGPTPGPGSGPTGGSGSGAAPGAGPGVAPVSGKPVTPPSSNSVVVKVDTSNNIVKSTTAANGRVTNIVTQNDVALAAALTQAAGQNNQGDAPIVSLSFNNQTGEGVTFSVASSVLASAAIKAPNTIISFQTNDGEYSLPISVLDFVALAQSLGTANENISIQVNISISDTDMNAKIKASAKNIGTSQIGSAIEFSVHGVGNGKTIEINNFGSTYVSRSIVLTISSSADTSTVVLYDPATGKFSFVPAVFAQQTDGTTKITLKRNGNSIYTVLSSTKTFTDINKHWAKDDIELLASKLVVNGVTGSSFAPESNITRAEFTTLLVRSLALTDDVASASFKDVKSSDWFAGAIGAAVKAKLVDGYNDNNFNPNATITREQMAVMVSRAINITGIKVDNVAASSTVLAKFSDKASISSWAQEAVAQSVEANIISGMTDKTFVPTANATRAQAVVMLKRLLQYTSFIN